MKQIILLLFMSSIVFSAAESLIQRVKRSLDDVQLHSLEFRQELDHFDPRNTQTWNQRYWVTATYYKKNGPAFLFLHGEAMVTFNKMIFPDTFLAYAKELNAMCFSLEHRFYGKGWPENETIGYLSSRQALGDIKNFIISMTKEFKFKHTNWITFGCSYAGTLATWARLKLPGLIHGAVASSAPLLAKGDYYQNQEIVERSMNTYNPKCVESITSAFEEIALNFKMNRTIEIKNSGNAQSYFLEPKSALHDMLKIIHFAVRDGYTPIICDAMINYEGSKVQGFFEFYDTRIRPYLPVDGMIKLPSNYVCNSRNRMKDGWIYQNCLELGFITTFTNATYLSPIVHMMQQYEEMVKTGCQPFFGSNFSLTDLNANINRTNSFYGGLDINVENIVFIHGSLDPWHLLGLYKKRNDSLYEVIFIEGTSHCADLYPSAYEHNITELKTAREKILQLLKLWLKKNE